MIRARPLKCPMPVGEPGRAHARDLGPSTGNPASWISLRGSHLLVEEVVDDDALALGVVRVLRVVEVERAARRRVQPVVPDVLHEARRVLRLLQGATRRASAGEHRGWGRGRNVQGDSLWLPHTKHVRGRWAHHAPPHIAWWRMARMTFLLLLITDA